MVGFYLREDATFMDGARSTYGRERIDDLCGLVMETSGGVLRYSVFLLVGGCNGLAVFCSGQKAPPGEVLAGHLPKLCPQEVPFPGWV